MTTIQGKAVMYLLWLVWDKDWRNPVPGQTEFICQNITLKAYLQKWKSRILYLKESQISCT